MIRFYIIFLLIVTTIVNCTNKSQTYAILEKADSLLAKEDENEALKTLETINQRELKTDEERAYYYLLTTSTQFKLCLPIVSDTAINRSINYYRQSNNKKELAKALYYKGMVKYELGDVENAIICIKEAEHLAMKVKDTNTLNLVYTNLAAINNATGNNITALEYAIKALDTSKRMKDKRLTALALDQIGKAYSDMGAYDRALYYMKKAIPYVKYLKKHEKAEVLANISGSYFNQEDFANAKHYIKMAMDADTTAKSLYILGSIYLEEGRTAEAEALWRKAWCSDNPELRAETMMWLADMKRGEGDYRQAAELTARGEALRDSIRHQRKAEGALRLQGEAERAEAKRKADRTLAATAAAAAAVATGLAALAVYHRKRMNRTRRRLAEIKKLTDAYRRKIDELTASKGENEREIKRLRRKIESLGAQSARILGHGRKLCESIAGGGTVAKWKKTDFEAAVEYCRATRPEAVAEIEDGHKLLTAYNTFFLLLPAIGVGDGDIPYAMNMTPGAARTMKYRLRGKVEAAC